MKHIGWCLDQIQITMAHIPRKLDTVDQIEKATHILNEVQEYADTLAELITHKNFKKHLQRLEQSSIQGIQLQAQEVKTLFEDLEHMLYVLDLYLKNLKKIVAKRPDEWSKKADQIVLMIDQKFGGERGELRKEFQVTLHAEEELKELVSSEKHLAEFLK